METIIGAILSYLISLAAGLRGQAILEKEKKELKKKLEKEAEALQGIQDRRSLREQLRLVGTNAARITDKAGITNAEKPLFMLLTDEVFQEDMAKWLTAWRPEEKKNAEVELAEQMVKALQRGGVDDKQIGKFKSGYFDRIEKVVFSDPVLANWRLSLALNAAFERLDELEAIIREEGLETRHEVQEQHKETRQTVAEMAAQEAHRLVERFSEEQRQQAVSRYRELALESCDIIDLANLPEGDRHIAARQLELRRLYVPLRVQVEITLARELAEADLEKIEKQREKMRMQRIKDKEEDDKNRVPAGERLAKSGRMVLLGDPGAGKTTLIRWVATAYLLRLKQDPAYKDLPDVATLPDKDWLPIVIRCRDLDESCKTGSIDDVLCETFRKAQMAVEETAVLQAVIREMLVQGEAILLVDGLDEIGNIGTRARFCQQIERLHIAFPNAPMIVTSRIVGYREMKYRIGRGFEHATVSEFIKKDKDEFARRWCDITELPERREKATEELIQAIHSSDRIERLAGNPMLLTTLALVKRKVGKLPNRRADLYWEAVLVLLNWRSEVDEPIDHREAVPQLEYVAYEMCRQGVQRLREDEILELMEKMREEYPNVRAAKKHEPGEFLRMLERRTGIIIEAGEVRYKGRFVPVFEFRHLTFQEFLAALALVDGKFPGRDKSKSLAEHIAPLAGQTETSDTEEAVVKDNWREVLRLCVACCDDDDVDEALMAILTPVEGEKPEETARPRAVLAALCLTDEPNVSDKVAQQVLRIFSQQVKVGEVSNNIQTVLYYTAIELVGSEWEKMLRSALIEEFCKREGSKRYGPGELCAILSTPSTFQGVTELHHWIENQVSRISSGNNSTAIDAALALMILAYRDNIEPSTGLVEALLAMFDKGAPSSHAGAWTLYWLAQNNIWNPTKMETEKLISFVSNPSSDIEAVYWSIGIFGFKESRAFEALIAKLGSEKDNVRMDAIDLLVRINVSKAIDPLIATLVDSNDDVRRAALGGLAEICEDEIDQKLLLDYSGKNEVWLDPKTPISEEKVEYMAKMLWNSVNEVRSRYEQLAEKYKLKLSWKGG
jgi:hypothetical protein